MNNDMDAQFLCKDCARFNQCQYYDRRKEDSYICKYFQSIENNGEWILDETDNSVTCNKCGCLIYPNDISNGDAHFCPNCGRKMKGGEE